MNVQRLSVDYKSKLSCESTYVLYFTTTYLPLLSTEWYCLNTLYLLFCIFSTKCELLKGLFCTKAKSFVSIFCACSNTLTLSWGDGNKSESLCLFKFAKVDKSL